MHGRTLVSKLVVKIKIRIRVRIRVKTGIAGSYLVIPSSVALKGIRLFEGVFKFTFEQFLPLE